MNIDQELDMLLEDVIQSQKNKGIASYSKIIPIDRKGYSKLNNLKYIEVLVYWSGSKNPVHLNFIDPTDKWDTINTKTGVLDKFRKSKHHREIKVLAELVIEAPIEFITGEGDVSNKGMLNYCKKAALYDLRKNNIKANIKDIYFED